MPSVLPPTCNDGIPNGDDRERSVIAFVSICRVKNEIQKYPEKEALHAYQSVCESVTLNASLKLKKIIAYLIIVAHLS